MHGEENLLLLFVTARILDVSEGSIVMTNNTSIESEVVMVRRANFREMSGLQLVDKKLFNASSPPCVVFKLE